MCFLNGKFNCDNRILEIYRKVGRADCENTTQGYNPITIYGRFGAVSTATICTRT